MQVGFGGRQGDAATSEINITPLIDVMLVLLTMLILTIPPQLHAVTLETRPYTGSPVQPAPVIAVEVDFDGAFYWNGEKIDRVGLERRLAQAAAQNPQPELHIRPNRLAEYRYVAAVMASAKRAGLTRIGVIQG
jgi:biopolymer transport protein ExbD